MKNFSSEFFFLFILFLQIVVESFPVSSSGHIFALRRFFSIDLSEGVFKALDHFAHGATLCIIFVLFWSEWTSIFTRLLQFKIDKPSYKKLLRIFLKIVGLVFVVDIITAIFYLVLKVFLKDVALLSGDYVLWVGLAITAGSLLSLRWIKSPPTGGINPHESWNFRKALALGVVQGVSLLPGVSRFASTYVAGRWLRLSPRRSLQISFLVHVPLTAAGFLYGLVSLVKGKTAQMAWARSVLFCPQGIAVLLFATVCGYFALRFVRRWVDEGKFWRFGIYVLVLLVLLVLVF